MRLRRIEAEFEGRVEVVWRTFLLRPDPSTQRSPDEFRRYTRSWLKPAAEPDSGTFRVWEGDAGPPSHSVPPHLVAKAAASLGREAFESVHDRLLHAYFAENRNVTDSDTLLEIWCEAGLPAGDFERIADPACMQQIIEEHNEAVRLGVNGVPAVRVDGDDAFVTGAYPLEMYRRWVRRLLESEPQETP